MTVADRILSLVGCVVEVPQQGGDGPFVAVTGRNGAHVLQVNRWPVRIDIEADRVRAGHEGAGCGLVVVGVPLAKSQARAVRAGIGTGQGVRAAGVLVAAKLVVGKVAPLVNDD